MDKFVIKGGIPLRGTIRIGGAKNAALPIMAACLLCSSKNTILNIPDMKDVKTMQRLLEHMGAQTQKEGSSLTIDTTDIKNFIAPYELVKTMRASVLVLGPLLARYGFAKVSLPGGCAIGARPINLHLMGLQKMGADIQLESGYVVAKADRLKGAVINFDIPTVTGTENIMMSAVLAKGTTVIENAAMEPEVEDLARCLQSVGAKINGAGQRLIEIEGVDYLKPINMYEIIPDRIQIGTYMTIAGITNGEIVMKGCSIKHLEAVVEKLTNTGIVVQSIQDGIKVKGCEEIRSQDIKTMPYPGFPTDMQAQFMALMTVANGTSVIKENIFENRFMHVAELRRMGADISIDGSVATVRGVKRLKGAPVMATDLRASASLVIAALKAEGQTTIYRIYHLDRGYERMDENLRLLGADIQRLKDDVQV
ncbi:MAG: UDP-N-acetylglucosamine 1-carboxyvinyltransferase [Thermodesulfovibrionales bacterium]|nr:UDP-N-acetylglucosamine 1-carboxyvinyltransferase [Thermodesulfovibrionales bacterium]